MDHGIKDKPRIALIDALRGFAIAAILLIHTSNHFLSGIFPENEPQWLYTLGKWLQTLLYFCFEGKAYTLFALLFGYTFALQNENQRRKKIESFWRTLWRMILLIGFGVVDAVFFAGGDPLVFYAICMMAIIPIRYLSNRVLLLLSIFFLLQPLHLINEFSPFIGDSYIKYYAEVHLGVASGSFFDMALINITAGIKGCLLWALETGRMTQTIGLFLLGILFHRHKLLTERMEWSKLYLVFILATILFYLAIHFTHIVLLEMYYNLFFSFSIIALFVHLYRQCADGSNGWLQMYGRMSLTNFITQSLFGSFVFYPWGLGWGSLLGTAPSLLLAVAFLILQVLFSRWWFKHHKKGILEEIWYRLTWL